ncbi:MAG TPA: monovalent cation/H+ antiporter subunit D [Steroidobacteraceae bacterium]|nr:monovalent cation/H+ antiporter subunit D [Steroidobacteraceae bacterium]
MTALLHHLLIVPILAPLLVGALQLFLAERRGLRVAFAVGSVLVQAAAALTLLYLTTDAKPDMWTEGVGVYSIGDWPAPFGIVLVVDRLSALMLLLTSVVGLASLVYSLAYWDRVAPAFHSMFQFLLMGLNGAFLTGDLFNLFVFFEVLLASSYGLLLHGSGVGRVKAGLHYITVNLVAAFLFLIGVAMIYGMTGTLNMADLPARIAALAPQDRALFETGAAILGVAFLTKAGVWPLNFWLPATYSAASSPIGSVFSLMTKVGVYAVLRVGTLLASADQQTSFIDVGLFFGGGATIVYGVFGMLAARHLGRVVSYSLVASTGLLFMALGLRIEAMTAPVLLYLASSVLTTSAFFMLNGLAQRTRTLRVREAADLAPLPDETYSGFGVPEPTDPFSPSDEVGIAIPAAMAFLGLAFICCVLLAAGLPPLSGFVAKFTLLHAALTQSSQSGVDGHIDAYVWIFCAAVLVTGVAAMIAMTRVGLRLFWPIAGRKVPRLRIIEVAPTAFLILLCLGLTVAASPVMTYLQSAARSLHSPDVYIRVVTSAARAQR